MSFGGSVAAMISSLKNNKLTKRNFRNGTKDMESGSLGQPLEYKNKLTDEELYDFKLKLEREKKRRDRILIGSVATVMIVALGIVLFLIH